MRRLWMVAMIVLGCGDPPANSPWSAAEPEMAPAALTELAWRYEYVTAALGGDYDLWWRLHPDGRLTSVQQEWVHEHATGTTSYPITRLAGSWSLEDGALHLVAEDREVRLEHRFVAAVVDGIPHLRFRDGGYRVEPGEPGLTTRALRRTGPGVYEARYLRVETHLDETTRIESTSRLTISPPPGDDPADCTLTVSAWAAVDEDGEHTEGRGELSVPCTWRPVGDGVGWWHLAPVGEHPRSAGLDLGYEGELRTALWQALDCDFVIDPAAPELALPVHWAHDQTAWREGAEPEAVP